MNRTLFAVAGVFSASSLVLVDSAAKGTALLVLAAVAAMILRRDSAATRHFVWLLAIVAMLAAPGLSAMLPQWRVLPEWANIPPATSVVATTPRSSARPDENAFELPQNAERVEVERSSGTATQPGPALPDSRPVLAALESRPESADGTWNWLNAVPLVWAIGFYALLLRLVAARLMLWNTGRQGTVIWTTSHPAKGDAPQASRDTIVTALEAACFQLGICRPVTLSIHPEKTIPVVWGILRCQLLLPVAARQWTGEQLRSVLLHELAHVKRRDTLAQLLTQIACALYWFHPLVWFAAWRLGVERERACDDLVLASGVRPSAYAGHLLEVVTGLSPARWTQSCGLAMARQSSLEGRLVAVLSEHLNRRRVSVALSAVALAIGAGIVVPVAMLSAVDETAGGAAVAATGDAAAPQVQASRDSSASQQDEQPPVMKPKHESGRLLFKIWQDSARTDGKIPGGALRSLAAGVARLISLNPTDERVPKVSELLKRIDTSHDWTQADAVALLNDLTDIYPALPEWAGAYGSSSSMGGPIRPGEPLPAELKGAAWGAPAASGLCAAWLLEPVARLYPLGTNLKSRILFHNTGNERVVFRTPDWHQYSNHQAREVSSTIIQVSATEWTRLSTLVTIRLAPGEYAEVEAHGIAIGPQITVEENWAGLRVGAWIEAVDGDEVTFQPATVGASEDAWIPPAERRTPLEMWKAIVDERIDRETPIPAGRADREQLIRRVTLDLIGVPPTPEEIARFTADDAPDARTALANRLVARVVPFAGNLPAGKIKFRVTAADPDAAKKPRVATGPGWYTIGDNVRLSIAERPDGNRRLNEARILFFSPDQKAEPPGKPHEIKLPDGHLTWAIAWERGRTVLWVVQKGLVRKLDFTDPGDVKETRFEDGGIVNVPEHLRDAFRKAFDVPGAPVQQQESLKPKEGVKLDPAVEARLEPQPPTVPAAPVPNQDAQKPKGAARLQPATEAKLEWGEPVNGLRMALAWPPALGEPAAGDVADFYLAVQNASKMAVRLCTTVEAPHERWLDIKEKDRIVSRIGSKEPNGVDVTLQPQEVVFLRLFQEAVKDPNGASAGAAIASDIRQSTRYQLNAALKVDKAPAGAWTGAVTTPNTRAGVGAEAPKNRKAQELFKVWLNRARLSGKIPGGFIARMGEHVKGFVKGNAADAAGAPFARRMEPLLPRLDGSRDWQPVEAATLLNDIAAVSDAPLSVMLEEIVGGKVQHGLPLPPELEKAPWGEPVGHGLGLRTATMVGPGIESKLQYVDWIGNVVTEGRTASDKAGVNASGSEIRMGTPLGCRILVHNAGQEPVVFHTRTWHHIEPTAKDARGAEIGMESVTRYTRAPLVTFRLEPGRYIELAGPGFGLGKYGFHDFKNADIATWIGAKEGDRVTLTPGVLPLHDWNEVEVLDGEPRWWLDFITARLNLVAPLPADPAERKELLNQAMSDLFRQDIQPTETETTAFLRDTSPQALTNLAMRLHHRTDLRAWAGPLRSGPTRFRVLPADPKAPKPPEGGPVAAPSPAAPAAADKPPAAPAGAKP